MTASDLAGVRTWLYVPADRPDRIDKAMASTADAVIIDLEDAIAPDHKDSARAELGQWLATRAASPASGSGPMLWVRINSTSIADDVAIACHPLVAGICLPKTETVEQVTELAGSLDYSELLQLDHGAGTALMLLIETARGVLASAHLAQADERVSVLQIGELDLRAGLGLPPRHLDRDASLPGPIEAARNAIVIASAAAGLVGPVGPVSPNIHDAGLEAETALLRHHGFGSRAVIHPDQLAPVAAAFAPSGEEIEWARRVTAASRAARQSGSGVAVVDGAMIDAPVERQALAILAATPDPESDTIRNPSLLTSRGETRE